MEKKTVIMLIAALLVFAALIGNIIAEIKLANVDLLKAYEQGKLDAINGMKLYSVDYFNPYAPRQYVVDGKIYDLLVYVELDGEMFLHGLYEKGV